jgi:hypothetical protein
VCWPEKLQAVLSCLTGLMMGTLCLRAGACGDAYFGWRSLQKADTEGVEIALLSHRQVPGRFAPAKGHQFGTGRRGRRGGWKTEGHFQILSTGQGASRITA